MTLFKLTFKLKSVNISCEEAIQSCVPQRLGNAKTSSTLLELARTMIPQRDTYEARSNGTEVASKLNRAELRKKAFAKIYADRPSDDAKRKQFERDLKFLSERGSITETGDDLTIVAE